jgi:hypothetical protein
MKHAYLIMAHDDFYLLEKLIQVIDNPDGDIFIHLDAKRQYSSVQIDSLKALTHYSNLYVYSQIPVVWGGSTLVKCELFLMEKAFSGEYGYYHLLSGHDFLLKPIQQIQEYYEMNNDKVFLAVDHDPLNKLSMFARIDQYHINTTNRHITMLLNRFTTILQNIIGIHRVKNTPDEKYFAKGMEWASMPASFVKCVLKEKKFIMQLGRYSLCFDELYKQMVYLKHQDEFSLNFDIENSEKYKGAPRYKLEVMATLHKVDWERGTPYTYRNSDYDELIHSHCMFARKFDSRIDKEIINRLFEDVKRQ